METEQTIQYRWCQGTGGAFGDARTVRRQVFVQEQGYSLIGEFDRQDENSIHIIGYKNGVPLCTARMFSDGPGRYHVGRVAVLAAARGKGVGKEMMRQLQHKAAKLGAKQMLLNAQSDKTAFYEAVGYRQTGKQLLDEGQPHSEMVLQLG